MVRLGIGSYVGFGLVGYATNGTNADMDMYFAVGGDFDVLQVERDRLEFDDLTSDFQHVTAMVAGHRRVTGSVKLKATYGGMQDLLRAITGHNDAPAVAGGGFQYDFVPVSRANAAHHIFGSTPRGWCIEVFRGGTATNSTFYQGCVITSAKFSFKPNSYVEVDLTFVGRGYTRTAKTASPTFKTDRIKTPTGQSDTLQLGGTYYVCHSADIEISLQVEGRYDVGAIEMKQPLPTAKQMLKLTAEIEVDDDSFLDKLNDPEGSRFTGGNALAIVESATKSLSWTFDELLLESPSEPRATSLGVVKTQLSMTAQAATVSVPSYSVSLINLESAYNT